MTFSNSINAMSAKSYSKIIGSNDRIHIAVQGLGRRCGAYMEAIADKKNNVHVNTIAPVAATRMTENLGIPEEVFNQLKPELISPAVLYLASDDAPTGTIIEAGAGYYSKVQIVEGKGVKLGQNATLEDVAANWDKITDMSEATPFDNGAMVTIKIFSP